MAKNKNNYKILTIFILVFLCFKFYILIENGNEIFDRQMAKNENNYKILRVKMYISFIVWFLRK